MSHSLFILAFLLFSIPAFALEIQSNDFKEGDTLTNNQVFNGFGCSGKNISPELHWTKIPEGTQSFAVTVYDPDAPTGSGWWHWTVFNIPATVTSLVSGASQKSKFLPKGAIEGRTDFGKSGFGGACPPPGDKAHKYIFTVYALKIKKIDLKSDAPAAMVGYFLNQNMIEKATIHTYYSR